MWALNKRIFCLTLGCAVAATTSLPAASATAGPEWEPAAQLAQMIPADAAVSPDGEMAVVLRDGDDVFVVRRPVGAGWGGPESLGPAEGSGWPPQVAYDGAGNLLVAWSHTTSSGTAVLSRRTADDGTWDPLERVAARATGTATQLVLSVNPAGSALLGWIWIAPDGSRLLVSARPAGEAWSPPARLGPAVHANVAIGAAGHAAVVMSRVVAHEVQLTEVLALVRASPNGTWSDGENLDHIPGVTCAVGLPDVVVDLHGITTVVWRTQTDDGHWQLRAGRARAGGGLRMATVDDTDLGAASVTGPQLVSTPRGDVALVTWAGGDGVLMARRWAISEPDRWGPATELGGADDVLFWSTAMERNGRALVVWTRGGQSGTDGLGVMTRRMNELGSWGPMSQLAADDAHVLLPLAAQDGNRSLAVWWQCRSIDHWVSRASGSVSERGWPGDEAPGPTEVTVLTPAAARPRRTRPGGRHRPSCRTSALASGG